MAFPLPSRFFAPVSRSPASAPSALAPSGPSAVESSVIEAYSWSTSMGVAFSAAGRTASSSMVAPPE